MATARLTSEGRVTIPKKIRDRLGWCPGDRLDFVVDRHGRVVVERVTGDIRELRGMLRRPGRQPVSAEEMDEAIGRHLAAPYGRDDER